MVTGCFFTEKEGTEESEVYRVAHPNETWLKEKGEPALSENYTEFEKGLPWTPVVCFPPFPRRAAFRRINSPVQRAALYGKQLNVHRRMFLKRDVANSVPSAWMTISDKIQNSGHSKPWFRSIGTDYVDTFSNQLSRPHDYEKLIADRREVINSLGSATVETRAQARAGKNEEEMSLLEPDAQQKTHSELILSDGYQGTQTRQLQSLGDALTIIDRLECATLQIMGVPPSAIGRNQNSERMASANQLVSRSMKPFFAAVEKYQAVIETALRQISETDAGDYVGFGAVLSPFDLERLEGIMKPGAVKRAYADAYNVPLEWIDESKIVDRQSALKQVSSGSKKQAADTDDAAAQELRAHKKRKQETAPPKGAKDAVE